MATVRDSEECRDRVRDHVGTHTGSGVERVGSVGNFSVADGFDSWVSQSRAEQLSLGARNYRISVTVKHEKRWRRLLDVEDRRVRFETRGIVGEPGLEVDSLQDRE